MSVLCQKCCYISHLPYSLFMLYSYIVLAGILPRHRVGRKRGLSRTQLRGGESLSPFLLFPDNCREKFLLRMVSAFVRNKRLNHLLITYDSRLIGNQRHGVVIVLSLVLIIATFVLISSCASTRLFTRPHSVRIVSASLQLYAHNRPPPPIPLAGWAFF